MMRTMLVKRGVVVVIPLLAVVAGLFLSGLAADTKQSSQESVFSTLAGQKSSYPFCGQPHCGKQEVWDTTKATCEANGWGSGVKVVSVKKDGTRCYCWCSCLGYHTPVAVAPGTLKSIQTIKVGEKVLVLEDENSAKWIPKEVEHSAGTPDHLHHDYVIYIKFGGKVLVANADHLFWTIDVNTNQRSLIRADRLTTTRHQLVSAELNPVPIELIWYGEFEGGLWHIATSRSDPTISSHLINTAGVVSGDYYLQLTIDQKKFAGLPQVGSLEYEAQYPAFMQAAASFKPSQITDEGFRPAGWQVEPPNVKYFLPPWLAQAKMGMLRPLDDNVTKQKAEQIEALFKGFYPEIEFDLEWNNNTVNAIAWKSGGKRYIRMYGGLVRHVHIRAEAVALVYAHEVGHHYAGAPTYPGSDLSCEGQADYWASLISMRKVYPEDEYLDVMVPAIDQLHNLFSKGLVASITAKEQQQYYAKGCSHPPADCRRDTYWAGVRLEYKPSCASVAGGDD